MADTFEHKHLGRAKAGEEFNSKIEGKLIDRQVKKRQKKLFLSQQPDFEIDPQAPTNEKNTPSQMHG